MENGFIRVKTFLIALAFLVTACSVANTPYPNSEKLDRATVEVVVDGGHGSGVSIGGGYILTANHVVTGAKSVSVITSDGVTVDATVMFSSATPSADVAVLKLKTVPAKLMNAVINCNGPQMNELLTVVGQPLQIQWAHAYGYMATKRPIKNMDELDDGTYYITSIPFSFGDSGGPVFNGAGELVGLMEAVIPAQIEMFPFNSGYNIVTSTAAICPLLKKSGLLQR